MASNDDSFQLETGQSPSKVRSRPQSRGANHGTSGNTEADKSREEALRQELASVKKVNETIEGVLHSLEKAKANMKVSRRKVSKAAALTSVRRSTAQSVLRRNC